MGDQSDPPSHQSHRRRRFIDSMDDSVARMRDELPSVPVIAPDTPGDLGIDGELRRRCEVILEQVAEINGILTRGGELPTDYTRECRDLLVGVTRSTEEILESVTGPSRQPGSMSAWLLRLKR